MDGDYVLVVGSAGIDVRVRPADGIAWGSSSPGIVRNSVGGVARNIAENLGRLEVPTILLTLVGDDVEGRRVIDETLMAGVNCDYIIEEADSSTAGCVSVLAADGSLSFSVIDISIMDMLDSDYLLDREQLFAEARMIAIDAALTPDALDTLFELASRYRVPVCADPTTPYLASRLRDYIPQLHLVVPNAEEAAALCHWLQPAHDRETALMAARHLAAQGANLAVVTLGEMGLVYADGGGGGFIRARQTQAHDDTGVGDAFTAAVIFGLLNDVPVDEAMRLGATAASLTLQSPAAVVPDLSQEMLYEALAG